MKKVEKSKKGRMGEISEEKEGIARAQTQFVCS